MHGLYAAAASHSGFDRTVAVFKLGPGCHWLAADRTAGIFTNSSSDGNKILLFKI